MPTRKNYQVKAWSHSAFTEYTTCPARFAYAKRDRLPKPSSPQMERGIDIHRKAEFFLKGKIKGVPRELLNFESEMKKLKAAGAFAEEMWAVTKTYAPCEWDDWDNAWLRVKTDAHVPDADELDVIDFKTGRIYEEKAQEQADVIALASPSFYEFAKLTVEFWYLDKDDALTYTYELADCLELRAEWAKKLVPMFSDKSFRAKPSSQACRYCPYRSDTIMPNGQYGPCTLWV